jgi:5-methyltetrahydrofolate--homocysteine methyltransferase
LDDDLVGAITGMDEKNALAITRKMLDGGTDPARILELSREAMEAVGDGFERGDFFLPELVMSGEILRQITDVIKPLMKDSRQGERLGRLVIGTVQGDIHDLGKDIVSFMLDVSGFEVHDLGVDVPPERFVGAARELRAFAVGLSGLLTLAVDAMKSTVETVESAGLRSEVKIMIGGGAVDERIREYVGADAYGKDAVQAVALAREWAGVK